MTIKSIFFTACLCSLSVQQGQAQNKRELVEEALDSIVIQLSKDFMSVNNGTCSNCATVDRTKKFVSGYFPNRKHVLRATIENLLACKKQYNEEDPIDEYLTGCLETYLSRISKSYKIQPEDYSNIVKIAVSKMKPQFTSNAADTEPKDSIGDKKALSGNQQESETELEKTRKALEESQTKVTCLQKLVIGTSTVLLVVAVALVWLIFGKRRNNKNEPIADPSASDNRHTRESLAAMGGHGAQKTVSVNKPDIQTPPPILQPLEPNKWLLVGASALGKGHLSTGVCQDNFFTGFIKNSWYYIVVCDGAGSASLSDKGSEYIARHAMPNLLKDSRLNNWAEQKRFPNQEEWRREALDLFQKTKHAIKVMAQKNNRPVNDFASTIILVVFNADGLLSAHVGDGRAAYRDGQEEWSAILTPFKGKEANSTVFITSDWPEELIETRVIYDRVTSVAVLTDGCEQHAFECSNFDPLINKWTDPNRPFKKFFEPVTTRLVELKRIEATQIDMENSWKAYLEKGTPNLENETDDKTMVIAVNLNG